MTPEEIMKQKCRIKEGYNCPNLKEIVSSSEYEKYECADCGFFYKLYYEVKNV